MRWVRAVCVLGVIGCNSPAPAPAPPAAAPTAPAAPPAPPPPAPAAAPAPAPAKTATSSGVPDAPPGSPPYREVPPAALEAARAQLATWVKNGASDPTNPWALAHGLLAYGKDHKASDGRLAIDVMVGDFLETRPAGNKTVFGFPRKTAGGTPVEPHRDLIVKSMLESGVPLDRSFKAKTGGTVTLAKLVQDMELAATPPSSETEWHDWAWTLGAILAEPRPRADLPSASGPAKKLPVLVHETLAYLEAQQGFLTELMEQGRPDLVKKQKQLIYSHTCGGMHLIQAVLRGAAYTKDPQAIARAKVQLDTLHFRWEAERRIYRQSLAQAPEFRVILLTQELKFYGHALETFALANRLGLYPATEVNKKRMALLAGDLVATIEALEGTYTQGLEQVRASREQTYLDLIGDGCHAIRGLREGLVAFFRP